MQKLNTKKRSLLLLASFAMLALWSNKASAQSSGSVTLNVKLDDIQSISVSAPTETLEYATAANYTGGVTLTVPNHLTVTSTGDFFVKVATSDLNFKSSVTTNTATIPVSTVSISAALGTTGGGLTGTDLTTIAPFTLSTTATNLIQANNEGFINGATFNVTYTAASLNTVAEPDTYSTNLTYSIIPQ